MAKRQKNARMVERGSRQCILKVLRSRKKAEKNSQTCNFIGYQGKKAQKSLFLLSVLDEGGLEVCRMIN